MISYQFLSSWHYICTPFLVPLVQQFLPQQLLSMTCIFSDIFDYSISHWLNLFTTVIFSENGIFGSYNFIPGGHPFWQWQLNNFFLFTNFFGMGIFDHDFRGWQTQETSPSANMISDHDVQRSAFWEHILRFLPSVTFGLAFCWKTSEEVSSWQKELKHESRETLRTFPLLIQDNMTQL